MHYDSVRLAEEIHPLLQHRALTNGTEATNVTNVVVAAENGGVAVIADKEAIGASRTVEDAAVAVRACLTQLAVARSGGLCVVHAGAARGFDMLCDDTTLLAGEPPLVRSVPAGLCIKRGAYAVLEPLYPRLASLPEWRRPDGRQARYLMPGNDLHWAEPDAAVAVRWIVFPRYHPDRGTALLPLPGTRPGATAARCLFPVGSLDERDLEKLIAWIEPDRLLRASPFIARCGHGAARRLPMSGHGHALATLSAACERRPATARSLRRTGRLSSRSPSHHLLTPALWSALGTSGHAAALPADAGDYLATLHRLNGDRNRALARQAIELIGALNAQGITPALLKGGLALFDGPYADPAVRMMRDLDVLVPAGSRGDAIAVLEQLGYRLARQYAAGHHAFGDFTRPNDPGSVDLTPSWSIRPMSCRRRKCGAAEPRQTGGVATSHLRHRPDHAQSAACADPPSRELLSR